MNDEFSQNCKVSLLSGQVLKVCLLHQKDSVYCNSCSYCVDSSRQYGQVQDFDFKAQGDVIWI